MKKLTLGLVVISLLVLSGCATGPSMREIAHQNAVAECYQYTNEGYRFQCLENLKQAEILKDIQHDVAMQNLQNYGLQLMQNNR